MTLSVRNGLLALAFGILVLIAAGYGFLSFLLVTQEGWAARVGQGTLLELLLQTIPLPVGTLVGFLTVRRAFRKSAAPELFFFALFLTALAGESFLLVQVWINLAGLPSFFTALLTRITWAFRLCGLFLLFCGSLFAFDFTFRKYGNMVAGSVACAVFLAAILPLHSSSARNHLLFAVGDAPGMVLVSVILGTAVAVNYLAGARKPGAQEQAWLRAWAAVSFLSGWALAIVAGPWGALLAGPGILLATWKAEENPLTA